MCAKRVNEIKSLFVDENTETHVHTYPKICIEEKYEALKTLNFAINLTQKQVYIHQHYRTLFNNTNINLTHAYEHAQQQTHLFTPLFQQLKPAGFTIPSYGCANMTNVETMLMLVEAFRFDASFGTELVVHNSLTMRPIYDCGTDKQKEKYLPKMANYELMGAFGLTEPEIGSDAANLLTTATPVQGGWLLNGKKRWIGGAITAHVVLVWARNEKTNNINGFLVDTNTPGYSTTKIENKFTLRIVQNANIILENCFVPEENRFPTEGFGATTKSLQSSRAMIAFGCTGLLLGAYERAVTYCTKRHQFNKPLVSFQLVQEKLMRVLASVQSTMLTSLHIAKLMDCDEAEMKQIALAKATCSRLCREGASLCREVCGGNGVVADYGVIISMLDAEGMYTYEGTYDINTLISARSIFGVNAIR